MADIRMIMELAGCSQENAEQALANTGDVMAAIESMIKFPPTKYQIPVKRKRELDPVQEHLAQVRRIMEDFDKQRSTSEGQHGYEGQVELTIPRVEMALQNNCSLECQKPAQE